MKMKASIFILLFIAGFLWGFDGIIGWKRITFIVMLSGLLLLFTKKGGVSKTSLIWISYSFTIGMSLLINNALNNWSIYMFLMYSSIILYAIFIRANAILFKPGIIFLVIIGIFNSIMVLVHFILKESFNNFYFPYLKYQGALETATNYYQRGYFFGLNYKPHEVAGIIVFAMAAMLIWGFLQKEIYKKSIYILAATMMFPLLLTGKKGVTACFICVFMLILLVWYAHKKQWLKIGVALGFAILLIVIVIAYIVTHPDNPLFYRFSLFFSNLESGQSVDAGRGDLRNAAWQLWKENKWFGVGWFQFNGYTVSRFGFSRTHSVNLDYLQFLCETGIIGFVLIMIPIISMIKRTFTVWKYSFTDVNMNAQEKWIILFAVFVQGFTILYAFIEVPFYDIMYFIVYIFSCMIINNAYEDIKSGSSVYKSSKNMVNV